MTEGAALHAMREYMEKPGERFRDKLDPKVADWIQSGDDGGPDCDVAIMGAPLSKTSISHSAAFRLPDAIRAQFQSLTPYSVEHRLALNEVLKVLDLGNVRMHLTDLLANQVRIEEATAAYWRAHPQRLIVFGGDHSITGSSVLGYVAGSGKQIGILHFDAHHDVRNLEDGGRSNGTPFRTILESGHVDGRNIVQVGLRDFTNAKAYHEYVLSHGVSVVTARQVYKERLASIVQRAVNETLSDVDAVYVSFDMDVLDQSFVPGVPAPGPGGMSVWEALGAMEWLGRQPCVEVVDVVCADPTQDVRDLTTRVAANLVLSFLTGTALAKRALATN